MKNDSEPISVKAEISQAIIAESNIKETLDTYPELKDVLVKLSPRFKKMQNVAVYNTLARFANFSDAAKISGVSLCEILHTLNRHLGTEHELQKIMPRCIQIEASDFQAESDTISWQEGSERFVYQDKSMSSLIQRVSALAPQECLVIFSVDQPNELLKVAQGLNYKYNMTHTREFRVSIFNPQQSGKVSSWVDQKEKFEILDVRTLSENPFDAILGKAESMEDGGGFVLIQTFEPLPMIKKLSDMGFEYYSEKVSESEYRIYFFKAVKKASGLKGLIDDEV